MSDRATVSDMVKVVKLTYNGRECSPVSIAFGTFEQGAAPRIMVTAMLPKDWDQGPAPEILSEVGHRFVVEQCVIEPENGDAVRKVVVKDRWNGKRWEFTR